MPFDDTTRVISLESRSKAQFTAPLTALQDHWSGLLNGDIPSRSDIDPRRIQDQLENAFIVERLTDRLAKFRVAGSHLGDLAGLPVAGMPMGTLFTQTARSHLARATQALFSQPAIVRLELRAPASVWATPMTGEMILLPLRSDLGDVTRALGGLVTQGRIGDRPRRFDITRIVVRPVEFAHAQNPAPIPKAAPAGHPNKPAFLRLVVDNA